LIGNKIRHAKHRKDTHLTPADCYEKAEECRAIADSGIGSACVSALNAVGIEVQRHRKSSDYGVIDSSMRNGEGDGAANER
jgi:hypothetical protein